MLSLLKVFQHTQIAHHGLRAAASAIGRVWLLLEMSSDQFSDEVPKARVLSGKHGTMHLFLPTRNPVFQR